MAKRRKGRIYLKCGRWYGDFRDLGGKQEALIPNGEKRATSDQDVAADLATKRVKVLEAKRRGIGLIGIGEVDGLGKYAAYHLQRKQQLGEATDWSLTGVQLALERACEFFGADTLLTKIAVTDVQDWATWLRGKYPGRNGHKVLSDGAVRHHLNALSNLYKRAIGEKKLPLGCNPVAAWDKKPHGRPQEARWLEVHEAALLLEACKTYRVSTGDMDDDQDYEAIGDLHALIATHLLTGGRPAEVRGLLRTDVNFDRKTVTFRPNAFRRLKTDGSSRTVPLWPQLERILRDYLAGPNAPTGALLFPSLHRRVRGDATERMLTDVRGALDRVALVAGWQPGEIRSKMFRHTYCAARLQTLDGGAPVSTFTVSRELGHGAETLVKQVYGHLGTMRHRTEVVEYKAAVLQAIADVATRKVFRERLAAVRRLQLVA
jgi:integrase